MDCMLLDAVVLPRTTIAAPTNGGRGRASLLCSAWSARNALLVGVNVERDAVAATTKPAALPRGAVRYHYAGGVAESPRANTRPSDCTRRLNNSGDARSSQQRRWLGGPRWACDSTYLPTSWGGGSLVSLGPEHGDRAGETAIASSCIAQRLLETSQNAAALPRHHCCLTAAGAHHTSLLSLVRTQLAGCGR